MVWGVESGFSKKLLTRLLRFRGSFTQLIKKGLAFKRFNAASREDFETQILRLRISVKRGALSVDASLRIIVRDQITYISGLLLSRPGLSTSSSGHRKGSIAGAPIRRTELGCSQVQASYKIHNIIHLLKLSQTQQNSLPHANYF